MALRSIRLTSGLFDTSGANESVLQTSLADLELKAGDLSTLNAADLLAVLETGDSLPGLCDPMAPALGEESLDSSFLEGFRNLDDYIHWPIFGEETINFPIDMEVEDQTKVSKLEGANPLKRTAEQADLVCVSPPNPDHNDYVAKAKRPRPSTSSESEPVEVVDPKYKERRRKNNIASRRSRETRKQKFTSMELKAKELEAANEVLEKKVTVLEDLTKRMKDILVQKLSQHR